VDTFVVPVLKRRREYVREVRVTEKREKVQKKIQGRVEDYRIPTMLSLWQRWRNGASD
jgi:mRNA-degrading endonuclease toxin of MazEF toxin-antitoxin module